MVSETPDEEFHRHPGCCRQIGEAHHARPVTDSDDFADILIHLPQKTRSGERRFQCRICGRIWREWVQYVYNDEIYYYALITDKKKKQLPGFGALAAAGTFIGFVAGLFTLPPLKADGENIIWLPTSPPIREDAFARMSWTFNCMAAGFVCAAALYLVLRFRGSIKNDSDR